MNDSISRLHLTVQRVSLSKSWSRPFIETETKWCHPRREGPTTFFSKTSACIIRIQAVSLNIWVVLDKLHNLLIPGSSVQSRGKQSCLFHRVVIRVQTSALECLNRHLKLNVSKHIQIKHDDTTFHPQTTPTLAFFISINVNPILQGTLYKNKQTKK